MPASLALSAPPCMISDKIVLESFCIGNATMFNANNGFPPIAYISEREFAADICPKVYGSSTIGVKKSTVCSKTLPSFRRTTAASSVLV